MTWNIVLKCEKYLLKSVGIVRRSILKGIVLHGKGKNKISIAQNPVIFQPHIFRHGIRKSLDKQVWIDDTVNIKYVSYSVRFRFQFQVYFKL